MPMRDPLPALVALAIVGLFTAVAVFVPSYPPAPAATIGALPLGVTSFRPSLKGTYIAPCGGGTLPIRWAVFVYESNRSNATFRVSGAWTASRPTSVEFGFAAIGVVNQTSLTGFGDWMPVAHCPPMQANDTPPGPPVPPSLPTSGSVGYDVTSLSGTTVFLLFVRTFDPADIVQVTEPFTVTPR